MLNINNTHKLYSPTYMYFYSSTSCSALLLCFVFPLHLNKHFYPDFQTCRSFGLRLPFHPPKDEIYKQDMRQHRRVVKFSHSCLCQEVNSCKKFRTICSWYSYDKYKEVYLSIEQFFFWSGRMYVCSLHFIVNFFLEQIFFFTSFDVFGYLWFRILFSCSKYLLYHYDRHME